MKISFECKYCGHRWVEEDTNDEYFYMPKCRICGETKNLKAKEISPEEYDVFGYYK